MKKIWLERLSLSNYRNYRNLKLELDHQPIILTGSNGSGKTNLLEAVSLLAPGRGLRGAPFAELARQGSASPWAISANINSAMGTVVIGTGTKPDQSESERGKRIVRIDGETVKGSNTLGDYLSVSWLTPAMDGVFTGSASERRRFLDRLMLSFDPGFRKRVGHFERAMRQRNRLLETTATTSRLFNGLELLMAETGVSISAARLEFIQRLNSAIEKRISENPGSAFPWALLELEGVLEEKLQQYAAIEVEDYYIKNLAEHRDRDRAAKRTLEGPHRSDLAVRHGPKNMPAQFCSTGEQKALLVGIVLAHAELVKQMNDGIAPLILLDEIAAHFDESRRESLFQEIIKLDVQAWMTGTDQSMFESLGYSAQYFTVDNANISI